MHQPKTKSIVGSFIVILLVLCSGASPGISYAQHKRTGHAVASGHARPPSLYELYAMYYEYAVHIERKSMEDEKVGKNRQFFKHSLQHSSHLDETSYAVLLDSAHRYSAVDRDVSIQIAALLNAQNPGGTSSSSGSPNTSAAMQAQLNILNAQRKSSLREEVSTVRSSLGQSASQAFDDYLKKDYLAQGSSQVSPPAQAQIAPQIAGTRAPGGNPSHFGTKLSGENLSDINVVGSEVCHDYYVDNGEDEDDGSFTLCADSQMSYLGDADEVDLYAHLYAEWDDVVVYGWTVQGFLFVDGYFYDELGCHANYPEVECSSDIFFASPSGTLYQWYSLASFDFDGCDDDDDCYEMEEQTQSDIAEVEPLTPDINRVVPDPISPASSGVLTIDGDYLISQFQNPPLVNVNNQSAIFSQFYVSGFDYYSGTINVQYTTLPNALVGTQVLNVNNGFFEGQSEIQIVPPNPSIVNIKVNGLASSPLQAGASQSVSLTGYNFGSAAPTIVMGAGTVTGLSIGSPSVPSPQPSSSAQNPLQTVTFDVAVPATADANATVSFELHVNDGALDPNAFSPLLGVLAEQPVQPIILDLLAEDNNNTCAGPNIGQGAASAQQVVVGQLVSFTACIPQASFVFSASSNAEWTSPTLAVPYTFSEYAVQSYTLTNYASYSATPNYPDTIVGGCPADGALSGGCYPKVAAVGMVTLSPSCYGILTSNNFCDYQRFAFVVPGTYDFTFTYSLGNGTPPASATVEYVVVAPTPAQIGTDYLQVLSSPDAIAIVLDKTGPSLSDGTTNGISFGITATSPTPAIGRFQWVQIITSRQIQLLSPLSPLNCGYCNPPANQLDNVYPYPMDSLITETASDMPNVGLNITDQNHRSLQVYEVNDQFRAQMYLLWDPELNDDGTSNPDCSAYSYYYGSLPAAEVIKIKASTCSGSIPIPLASISWGYCGTAINTMTMHQISGGQTTWILSCPSSGESDVVPVFHNAQGASAYPTWSGTSLNIGGNP